MFARLVAYVRGIARRRRISAEAEDELRFHVEQEIEAHLARGVSPVEARRMALRDLGGLTPVTQAVRDVRLIWLDLLWRDARHAVRSLRRTPAFTSVPCAFSRRMVRIVLSNTAEGGKGGLLHSESAV